MCFSSLPWRCPWSLAPLLLWFGSIHNRYAWQNRTAHSTAAWEQTGKAVLLGFCLPFLLPGHAPSDGCTHAQDENLPSANPL